MPIGYRQCDFGIDPRSEEKANHKDYETEEYVPNTTSCMQWGYI
ncbi:hypothetical protein J14TS2_52590 [Bacillus sp. J14TS2]|nr:hypothetical protein J14TS2_52590 [Bacillus sp. J14TS2]